MIWKRKEEMKIEKWMREREREREKGSKSKEVRWKTNKYQQNELNVKQVEREVG